MLVDHSRIVSFNWMIQARLDLPGLANHYVTLPRLFFFVGHNSFTHIRRYTVTIRCNHPFKSCPENCSGWLAQWSSISAATLPQVAKMGKSSRWDLRYLRQGHRVVSLKRVFPCDSTSARGPRSPLVDHTGTRTRGLREQLRGKYHLSHKHLYLSFTFLVYFTGGHFQPQVLLSLGNSSCGGGGADVSDVSTSSGSKHLVAAYILFSIIKQSLYAWL